MSSISDRVQQLRVYACDAHLPADISKCTHLPTMRPGWPLLGGPVVTDCRRARRGREGHPGCAADSAQPARPPLGCVHRPAAAAVVDHPGRPGHPSLTPGNH